MEKWGGRVLGETENKEGRGRKLMDSKEQI
jgi:hypothetical protein